MKTSCLAGMLLCLIGSNAMADSAAIEDRASQFDKFLHPNGIPSKYLDVKITPGISKTRELRTVLPGALYRGGGPGGTKPMPADGLKALCEAGFSLAIYAYKDNWTQVAPVSCVSKVSGKANTLEYISLEANVDADKKKALARIFEVVMNPAKGPVLVHCWNGYHASGELAAVSLRQFCGWDGSSASAYWLRLANGAPMISRVKKFAPYSEFNLSAEIQSVLCKQAN